MRCSLHLSGEWVYPFVVSPRNVQGKPSTHGDVLTAISDGIVALLKEYYGRGPTRAKSYYEDDLVVCLLRGGFTRVEQTLLEGGRSSAVIEQRMAFQDVMRDRFVAVIEQATRRRVIGFMSGNQQDPDIMSEVFILARAGGRRRGGELWVVALMVARTYQRSRRTQGWLNPVAG